MMSPEKREGVLCQQHGRQIDPACEVCVQVALHQFQQFHIRRGANSDVHTGAFQEFLKWVVESIRSQEAEEEAAERQAVEPVEQARAYLAEQGFQPRKVGEEWQIVYPASGRPGRLTGKGLVEQAQKLEKYLALPAILRSNPTIGS